NPLFNGIQEINSRRGSSSHAHNPFFILCDKNATEESGNAYGFSLVYSGSFKALVDVDSFSQARAMIGLNPDGFSWELKSGCEFFSPEANMVFSQNGIGQMSRNYHKLYRNNLCRGKYKSSPRPVLINTWEACYFDFNEEKIEAIAIESAKLGIDLVVVDDGWFGKRDDDTTSLGDWFEDEAKLPNKIQGLAKKVNDAGCELGIWFEPEMINPISKLFENNPDWALKIKGRQSSLARKQLVLDMGRNDVCNYLFERISDIIIRGNIKYIKWDFNRNLTEVGSALLENKNQGEVYHRYVLGLYSLLEKLVYTYPDVLFESCSGGGGRFDPGMLYYMPQTWTSDNTDAMKRLKIQYGTSLIYPLSSISAHVSACPNHQTGTSSPAKTRKLVALTGSFGFELNPLMINNEEKEEIISATKMYKNLAHLLVNGEYYRLASPYETNNSSWM
ncbi:MAG: alpha-galactosidase, partial [Oscillospiraceae bacterium]